MINVDGHFNILGLVTVMLLAFAVPPLLSRIKVVRIPIAVGEILAGIIIGRSGLNLLTSDPALDVLSFLGLLYLMFSAGLEVDFQALARDRAGVENGSPGANGSPGTNDDRETNGSGAKAQRRLAWLHNPLAFGGLNHVITVALAYWWVVSFTDPGLLPQPLAFALLMSTVGFSIIMPVLKETNKLSSPFGQLIVGVAAIGDFMPVVAMTIIITLQRSGSVLDVLLLVALFLAAYLFYIVAKRFRHVEGFEGLSRGTAQIDVRGASLLMLVFGLLAQWLRVEVLLGAFLAGLLVSVLVGERREHLIHKMDAVGFGFLIPIFFVMVGVNFDIRVLFANPAALAFVPLLLLVLLAIKALPALLLRIWYPWRITLAGSALLTSQMSVTVAFSAVLLDNGMISEPIHAAVVLVAILTAILGPVVYTRLLPDDPDEVPRSGVILVGAGREGILIARRIQQTDESCVIIDADPEKVAAAKEAGVHAVQANALDETALESLGAKTARVMVALTGSDDVNLQACRIAANKFGVKRTVAIVRNPGNIEEAHWSGIEMINPGLATAALIEMMVTSPVTAQLVAGHTEDQRLVDVILRNRRYSGRKLRDAKLPPGILIVSIQRGQERLIPHGDTVLQLGDVLSIAGPTDELRLTRAKLGVAGAGRRR